MMSWGSGGGLPALRGQCLWLRGRRLEALEGDSGESDGHLSELHRVLEWLKGTFGEKVSYGKVQKDTRSGEDLVIMYAKNHFSPWLQNQNMLIIENLENTGGSIEGIKN